MQVRIADPAAAQNALVHGPAVEVAAAAIRILGESRLVTPWIAPCSNCSNSVCSEWYFDPASDTAWPTRGECRTVHTSAYSSHPSLTAYLQDTENVAFHLDCGSHPALLVWNSIGLNLVIVQSGPRGVTV